MGCPLLEHGYGIFSTRYCTEYDDLKDLNVSFAFVSQG